jgi:ribosomal protein S27AE
MGESDPKEDSELKTCPECGKGKMRSVRHKGTEQEQNKTDKEDAASDVRKRRCDNCGHTEIIMTINEDVPISATALGVVKTVDLTESPK